MIMRYDLQCGGGEGGEGSKRMNETSRLIFFSLAASPSWSFEERSFPIGPLEHARALSNRNSNYEIAKPKLLPQ